MKTLLDILRDDAWSGVQGILALAGAALVLLRFGLGLVPRVYWWWYDLYYEHVYWRLYGPPPGFNETATLTVKVVGVTQIYRDGSGQERARRLDTNGAVVKDWPLYD